MADPGGFDEFYVGTRLRLLRQLTAMVEDGDRAADALRQAYVHAWRRWHRVPTAGDPIVWVRRVAWRLAVRRRHHPAAPDRCRWRPTQGATPDLDQLRTALGRLRPDHRRVLVLREMCGLAVGQIAAETGVPEGVVTRRLERAQETLGEALLPAPADGRTAARTLADLLDDLAADLDAGTLPGPDRIRSAGARHRPGRIVAALAALTALVFVASFGVTQAIVRSAPAPTGPDAGSRIVRVVS